MNPPILVLPSSGHTYNALGDMVQFHLTGAETNGAFSMSTVTAAPGGGPPPHWHENEDEWFYVIEGRVSFFASGQWTEMEPGAVAFAPRMSVHTYKNAGDTPARLLVHTSPSGFEHFIAKLSDECTKPNGPDMGKVIEIAEAHGIRFAP
jgi:quercetin dioxygenase-like cupin family protein